MPIDQFDWVNEQPFFSVWGLKARGRPGPGPDFVRYADDALGLGALMLKAKQKDLSQIERQAAKDQLPTIQEKFDLTVDFLYRRALYRSDFHLNIEHKGRVYESVPFMRGGLWCLEANGPNYLAKSDVMLIGKHPGLKEMELQQNFVGPSSIDLLRACDACGIPDEASGRWYVTNLVKFDRPDQGSGELSKSWVADCLPLLWLELMLVRPKFILCLGSEAIKGLMGKEYNVTNMAGRMLSLKYKAASLDRPAEFDNLEDHEAIVMCVPHPAYVARKPEAFDDLAGGLRQFWDLVRGNIEATEREEDIKHTAVYSEHVLANIVDTLRARPGDLTIAIDAEWHGKHWNDDDAYLRTIQFSTRWKEAFCVVLNDVGGVPVFKPGLPAAIAQLKRLVADKPDGVVRVGGHAFRADMPWLITNGLDLREFFDIPEDWNPKIMPRGFDTLYLAHAAFEASETFKLENLAARQTTCPRWDVALQQWKTAFCKEHGLKDRDLEGYGMCPEDILIPYGNYDADSTRRLTDVFWGHCVKDIRGLDAREAYLNSMKAWLGFLEMEMTGVEIDQERTNALIKLYTEKAAQLKKHLQQVLNWPNFNPRSSNQCRELLFGVQYNGTIDKTTGLPKRLRPDDAIDPLDLMPIKTTGKPPKSWDQVVADGETDRYTASTDKETLGILSGENDIARLLVDIRFIGQVSTSVLQPPKVPKAIQKARKLTALSKPEEVVGHPSIRSGRVIEIDDLPEAVAAEAEADWDEDSVFEGGFVYYMNSDGRVRTHFYAAETGRCTSSRPPMQNLSKQRDADYQRILGYRNEKSGEEVAPYKHVFGGLCYKEPIRAIIRASPGCVLLEFDLMSAEIAGLAWEADDDVMMEDVRRAVLPEDHPDYIDLHAATAVEAFHLNCAPTKAGLESIGKTYIRVPAKNVRFGVPYGRSASAIARQCREQGTMVSDREAQALIDGWNRRYPRSSRFLARCEARPKNPGWMCGAFKRYRRFPETSDRKVVADMGRSAKNFPIQNLVADSINIAIYNMLKYRDANKSEGTFRMTLQIHDAVILEVPVAHVPWVYDHVLPKCVVDGVSVTPLDLDGRNTILNGRPPYHFGIDKELYVNWGEKLVWGEERNNLLKLGLDPKYLPKEKPPKKTG